MVDSQSKKTEQDGADFSFGPFVCYFLGDTEQIKVFLWFGGFCLLC